MSTTFIWAVVMIAAYLVWRTSRVLRKLDEHHDTGTHHV